MRKSLFTLTLLLLVACGVEVPETKHNALRIKIEGIETAYSIDATLSITGRNLVIKSESPEMKSLVGDWQIIRRGTWRDNGRRRGFILRKGDTGAQLIMRDDYSYSFALDDEYIFYHVYFSNEK